jgi:hypothetical protein
MPAYNPSDEELSGYAEDTTEVKPPEDSTPTKSVDEENAGASEILISKSKLPSGTKEGDECVFKVAKDFGDEVSLTYVKDMESDDEPTNDNLNATTNSEIAALDKEG